VVVSRFAHPAKVVAVDARRGKLLWEQSFAREPLAPTFTDLERHSGIRSSLLDELQRRWFGDSVRGRMSTDGRRLFLVSDLDDLDLKPGAGSRLRNHLEAWDVATGERRWRIGSSVNEPPTGFQGLYFLGPPLVSDGLLYVVAQREFQVALWVLRASDGQLEWMLPLAETDRQQFKETGWRHVACPVTWSGGRLICPTGAGCFVAVDPVTRSLSWSVRYERDDIQSATGVLATDRERPFPVRWWESWREVTAQEVKLVDSAKNRNERSLVVAAPESRSLRAVDPQRGDVVWSVPFSEPLLVACHGEFILVLERHSITAVDPATGRERWHMPHSPPAGPGEWIGERYVYPLQEGGWGLVEAPSGTVRRSADGFWWDLDPTEPVTLGLVSMGPLVRAAGRWVVLTPSQVGLFESISAKQADVTRRAQSNPDDLNVQIELAQLAAEFGDWNKAEAILRPLVKQEARVPAALRQVLLRRLAERPADHSQLAAELLSLSRAASAQAELEVRKALIEAAQRSGDAAAALRGALEWLDLHPEGDRAIVEPVFVEGMRPQPRRSAVTRTVRQDRWAQGLIADLFAHADAPTRQQLDVVLSERRQRAIDSPDAFALLTLADQLSCLPLGRELRLQLSGRSGVGVGALPTSLALRTIAQASDRAAAAQAWYRLALLHDFRSEPLDAADCYRELRDHFSDVKLADGHSTAEWLSEVMPDSRIGRALSEGPRDPWPDRLPRVSSEDEPHDDVYCHPIRLQSRDPIWQRLSVSVERQGRKVRFHGLGQRGYWDLPLPKSNSPFRHAQEMHRGWGLGPLLVLQVGEELFGVQPLDERGETNAKLLWTVSVGPYEELGAHQFLPGRLGTRLDDYWLLDRYEQPVLEVVHASPSLVCYRTRNRLVAIEPVSGSQLWMRHHLPPLVSVTGDGEQIVLRLIATGELEVRRGFDGRLLARREDRPDPTSILMELGTQRVQLISKPMTDGSAATALRVQDLVRGDTVWERPCSPRSVPLRVDESRLGIVEPNGTLRFLSLRDGQELGQHDVPLPTTLTTAHVFGDDLRLFVILAGPVTEASWLATQQERGVFWKPLVNGWLHAFDRRSLRRLWTIPTKNLPLAIDQPRDAPVLVLTYKRPSDDSIDGQSTDGVLHLIDKRSGKEVLYDVGAQTNVYFALEPDPLQQRIDVLTPKRRLRLDYAGE
jgi:outer membrane protein assembly factor BamB